MPKWMDYAEIVLLVLTTVALGVMTVAQAIKTVF